MYIIIIINDNGTRASKENYRVFRTKTNDL